MAYILLGFFLLLLTWRTNSQARDINRLYSSRDSLWKELHAEGQARKRQVTLLRSRIHYLREELKKKADWKEVSLRLSDKTWTPDVHS